MTHPIEGFGDRETIVDAMLHQRIIQGDRSVAEALVDAGKLERLVPGQEFITQGAYEKDAFFILVGKVDLRVKDEFLYQREAGEVVGEFAAINPALARTATVIADTPCVVLRCSSSALRSAANAAPRVWELLAIDLTRKIEQRNRFISQCNQRPFVIILAAAEYVEVADEFELALGADYQVIVWNEAELAEPGSCEVDRLHKLAAAADFVIALAHPDDLRRVKDSGNPVPEDTILFELGYLMSVVTKHRTIILLPDGGGGQPPAFKGVQPLRFQLPNGSEPIDVTLAPILRSVRRHITECSIRSRLAEQK